MEERRGVEIVVGYAVEAKKVESFMKASLVSHASEKGILFLPLDPAQSLEKQYEKKPFKCIVHKLYGRPDWERQLLDFKADHPDVAVVDCPSAIGRVQDRISMLEAVTSIIPYFLNLGVPKQGLLLKHDEPQPPIDVTFPVVAKPLEADGHHLSLVFNPRGLEKVKTPAVLQEYVNHGGVLFKVYVAGEHVSCVKRKSLNLKSIIHHLNQDIIPFSRISNLPHDDDPEEEVEMPPTQMLTNLGAHLRRELHLNLFNFDMIKDKENKYLIIDINYFPGYAKLPGYEDIITNFFLDTVASPL